MSNISEVGDTAAVVVADDLKGGATRQVNIIAVLGMCWIARIITGCIYEVSIGNGEAGRAIAVACRNVRGICVCGAEGDEESERYQRPVTNVTDAGTASAGACTAVTATLLPVATFVARLC